MMAQASYLSPCQVAPATEDASRDKDRRRKGPAPMERREIEEGGDFHRRF